MVRDRWRMLEEKYHEIHTTHILYIPLTALTLSLILTLTPN